MNKRKFVVGSLATAVAATVPFSGAPAVPLNPWPKLIAKYGLVVTEFHDSNYVCLTLADDDRFGFCVRREFSKERAETILREMAPGLEALSILNPTGYSRVRNA